MTFWIRKIFGLCIHDWVDHHETKIRNRYDPDSVMGAGMVQRCSKCAKFRTEEF